MAQAARMSLTTRFCSSAAERLAQVVDGVDLEQAAARRHARLDHEDVGRIVAAMRAHHGALAIDGQVRTDAAPWARSARRAARRAGPRALSAMHSALAPSGSARAARGAPSFQCRNQKPTASSGSGLSEGRKRSSCHGVRMGRSSLPATKFRRKRPSNSGSRRLSIGN